MRVLLSTYGSRGDVEPLAGLALRLRELGAEVRVCAPPDEDFVAVLDRIGVPLIPVGPSARELTRLAPPPSEFPRHAAALIASQFELVTAAARDCDVLLATGMLPAAAGALSVAELAGIPARFATFQQLYLPSAERLPLAYPGNPLPAGASNREAWEFDARTVHRLFGEALNTSRVAHGLAPVASVRDFTLGEKPWLATDPVLDPWTPGEVEPVQTGAWILPDERPLGAELEAFLAAGEAPVYVGFGSNPMFGAAEVAQDAVAAARAHGRRVVLKRGWAELAQEDCFQVDEVNQQALFPRVAAVVHHGGAGTTTTAARAGAPQVVVPQQADQPYWARRVAELGAGVAHEGPVPTRESLTAALGTALACAPRAAEVAGLVRGDGARVAAELLLAAGK